METASKKSGIKNIALLLISLLLGAAGVFFSKQFIEKRISFYKDQMEVKEEMVEVVVPIRDMLRGEMVTGSDLALRSFPKKYVDSNVVTDQTVPIAFGQRLNFDIDNGKPLLWAHLEGGIAPTFSGKIEEGFRALTFPVNEINSISGFLQPKDNVDLMLTYSGTGLGSKEKVTFPFMQNLLVLATGIKTVTDKTGRATSKKFKTITVQVTPEEAKKIILAQEVGKITATLRHPDDVAPMSDKVMNINKLLGIKPKKALKKIPEKQGIEFIIGGV